MTETENRKAVRRAFLKFYRQWPTFGDDSDERAFAEWQAVLALGEGIVPTDRQSTQQMSCACWSTVLGKRQAPCALGNRALPGVDGRALSIVI